MKQPVRILLWVLCAALILAAPFAVSSPNLLSEVKWDLMEEDDADLEELDEEAFRWPDLFLSSARAEEELIVEETDDSGLTSTYQLPLDFSPAPAPNPACYTETGYEDASIRVRVESREEGGVIWHVAFVQIASPTQLRTATAVPGKLTSTKTATVSGMARYNNAVLAFSGDNFVDDPAKTTYEFRMTQKIRAKGNRAKDVLLIDDQGDFHFFLANANASREEHLAALQAEAGKYTVVNAYTFGPALVIDGQVRTVSEDYGYNPRGKEPRAAIGQTGPLSYVCVIAEGRGESSGVSHQELADFMGALGCVQAFNLDGGNSAEMVFGETIYKGMPGGKERSLSDMIYFASAIPEADWN